jgi:excisionase family DNA binding protein
MNLLTSDQVAEQLNISHWTVDDLRRKKRIPAVNVSTGRKASWRFRQCDVDEFILSRLTPVGSPAPSRRKRTAVHQWV